MSQGNGNHVLIVSPAFLRGIERPKTCPQLEMEMKETHYEEEIKWKERDGLKIKKFIIGILRLLSYRSLICITRALFLRH